LEGVYLSAMIPPLTDLVLERKCIEVDVPFRGGMALHFDTGTLVLDARTSAPSLWWEKESPGSAAPAPGRFTNLLKGAVVRAVSQQGTDRVMELIFEPGSVYASSDFRLVFEAAGRNANLILTRVRDGRILDCTRRVPPSLNRYRTIVPGALYVKPPSSGLLLGSWLTGGELAAALKEGNPVEALYRTMEGVGPVTAGALLREAEASATDVLRVTAEFEKRLLEGRFRPWLGPDGPLPVKLGPGRPIPDPLAPPAYGTIPDFRSDRLNELKSLLEKKKVNLENRKSKMDSALRRLVPPEIYRTWGNLLLSMGNGSRKGLEKIELTDWEGKIHVIPLKPSRSLVSNASYFFRKASNSHIERKHLEKSLAGTERELEFVRTTLENLERMNPDELGELLSRFRKERTSREDARNTPTAKDLGEGWRCYVGKNAHQNDEITFRLARKGDLWFHARGVAGAHVVLKMDGRKDPPPRSIIIKAALEAARNSRISSGVVPVDYTMVRYVRRIRKGKPGQVVYENEKTIFVESD